MEACPSADAVYRHARHLGPRRYALLLMSSDSDADSSRETTLRAPRGHQMRVLTTKRWLIRDAVMACVARYVETGSVGSLRLVGAVMELERLAEPFIVNAVA